MKVQSLTDYPANGRRRSPSWLLTALLCTLLGGGCHSVPTQPLSTVLGPTRMVHSVSSQASERWRFPKDSEVTLVSVNAPQQTQWAQASLLGLRQSFPRCRVGTDRPSSPGLTIYLQWPDFVVPTSAPRSGWIAGLPKRLGISKQGPSANVAKAEVGIVWVDNHSGRVVHQGQIRVHGHWLATDADLPGLFCAAFARYAQGLVSG